jgi:hypothetical protein
MSQPANRPMWAAGKKTCTSARPNHAKTASRWDIECVIQNKTAKVAKIAKFEFTYGYPSPVFLGVLCVLAV